MESNPQKIKDYAHDIHLSGKHLLDIVNELLDFSKIQAGKFQIEKMPLSLKKVFKDCYAILLSSAKEKCVTLHCNYQQIDEDQYVEGDETRLKQVINNIISNAIKFSENGIVDIYAQYQDQILVVVIKDNGIGMNEEVVKNLFKPFYQGDGSITRKFGGTGLGLTISKNIIDMMEGFIEVESEAKKGSTFRLTIPLKPVNRKKNPVSRTITALQMFGHRYHVLVAEDNPVNQLVLEQILYKFELNVTKATNGKEAFDLATRNKFDLILMDMQMPEMDGMQSTRMLREHGVQVPVIAVTANAYQDDRNACLESGMNDFVTKPLDLDALNTILKKYLKA